MVQNKVAVAIGTRPEIIKMQPVIKELQDRDSFDLLFVHTGQHYDWNMSDIFIEELGLTKPDVFLNVKSFSPGKQISKIIARFEKALMDKNPKTVLVQGDTNSALGCAIAASKLNIPICHVEAGCRSFDRNMPEEINRVLIADLAELHFAPTKTCVQNLMKEGVSKDKIFLTGHPIIDILSQIQHKIKNDLIKQFALREKNYYFVTVHRNENITNRRKLLNILEVLSEISNSSQIVFPLHPHTYDCIRKFKLKRHLNCLNTIKPVSYLEALSLVKNAKIVLTDSGGIQQEAALLKTPCITLRANTEWRETLSYGVNFLASSKEEIIDSIEKIEQMYGEVLARFNLVKSIFGNPSVSTKIVDILEANFK